MIRVLMFLVIVALAVYAVVDISNSDEDDRRGLPSGLWFVVAVVIPVLGPLLWLTVRNAQRAARAGGGTGTSRPRPAGPSSGPRRPQRPVAPDDDPEFLWRLEQEQRRRDREQRDGDGQGLA